MIKKELISQIREDIENTIEYWEKYETFQPDRSIAEYILFNMSTPKTDMKTKGIDRSTPTLYNGNELLRLDLACFGGLVVTPYWKDENDPEFDNILCFIETKKDIPKFKELYETTNVVFSVEDEMPPKLYHEVLRILNDNLPTNL